ncbi:hypothetical protein [Micromonospora chersina]|uniref:hypothetical protein n=1 Tax=Micromonospora chersina TaxID=47854 RepID=UPI003724ADA8
MSVAQPDRRLIMFVDMERYSRHDDMGQVHAQENFRLLMSRAAEHCGLDRSGWEIQETGDGELAIFPPGTSEPRVVADLVPALDRILRDHNRQAASNARVRMRVALHQGLVTQTANGYAGTAVVTAARLVEADAVKDALNQFPDAGVAMIVSAGIYRDVVCQSYSGIREDRYRRVDVLVKSFEAEAWVFVPDENANLAPAPALGIGEGRPDADSEERQQVVAAPEARTGSTFSFGSVTNHGATVFGDGGRAWGPNPSTEARRR